MTDPRTEKPEPVDRERNARLVESLYRTSAAKLGRIAARHGIRGEAIEDVVQSALLGILRSYRGPDDAAQLYSYAARAVQNEAGKVHRRHARKESRLVAPPTTPRGNFVHEHEQVWPADIEAADPLECVIAAESVAGAIERLRELPEPERAILLLGAAGYGVAEIAERVGLSERAVRKRVTRANARLRELGA